MLLLSTASACKRAEPALVVEDGVILFDAQKDCRSARPIAGHSRAVPIGKTFQIRDEIYLKDALCLEVEWEGQRGYVVASSRIYRDPQRPYAASPAE